MLKTLSIWGAILYSVNTCDSFPIKAQKKEIVLTFKKKEEFFKEIKNKWYFFQTAIKNSAQVLPKNEYKQQSNLSSNTLIISEFFLKECS